MPLIRAINEGKFEEVSDWAEKVVVDSEYDEDYRARVREKLGRLFDSCEVQLGGNVEGKIYAALDILGGVVIEGRGGALIGLVSAIDGINVGFELCEPGMRVDISYDNTRYMILHRTVVGGGDSLRKL